MNIEPIKHLMHACHHILSVHVSVEQAIAEIKTNAIANVQPQDCYITDENGVLKGKISYFALLRADHDINVYSIADKNHLVINENQDKEIAANLFNEHDLHSIAVIDDDNKLVGVINHKIAMKILLQEDQEDLERIMGISGSGNAISYRDLTIIDHIRNRISWLVGLAILGFVSGSILMHYESILDNIIILAIYLPMISDTGGNAGGQSASIIIRAISLGELTLKDTFKIIAKELAIGLGLALILAGVTMIKVWFFTEEHHVPGNLSLELIMLCVCLALFVQVITATLIGAVLPLLAVYFKQDPAVVASPAITTIVDMTGLFIYFSLANYLLLN